MVSTSLNNAHFLDVLAGLGADQGADYETRPGTLGERENGGKVHILVDTEDFGVRGVGVGRTVRVLKGHLESIISRKDVTVVEIILCEYVMIHDAMQGIKISILLTTLRL